MSSYATEYADSKDELGGLSSDDKPRFKSNGHGPRRGEHVTRKAAAYARLSPEEQQDRDRAERIDELHKLLYSTDLSEHDRPKLNAELHQLQAEYKTAHPEQVDADLQVRAEDRYQWHLAEQQAKARLASAGWTPPRVLTEDDASSCLTRSR